MLSILCSRIQGYMSSLMNEVDPCLLLPPCVLYEMQNQIFQHEIFHLGKVHSEPILNFGPIYIRALQATSPQNQFNTNLYLEIFKQKEKTQEQTNLI